MPARPAQLDAPFPVRERETGDGLRRCGDTGGPAGGDAHARAGAPGTRSGPQPAEAPVSAGILPAQCRRRSGQAPSAIPTSISVRCSAVTPPGPVVGTAGWGSAFALWRRSSWRRLPAWSGTGPWRPPPLYASPGMASEMTAGCCGGSPRVAAGWPRRLSEERSLPTTATGHLASATHGTSRQLPPGRSPRRSPCPL